MLETVTESFSFRKMPTGCDPVDGEEIDLICRTPTGEGTQKMLGDTP